MTLLENPLPIAAIGGLLVTLTAIVFLSRRDGASLAALAATALVTAGLLLVERFVATDREQVEEAVAGLLDAIEANDEPGVLNAVDPSAVKVRAEIAALMPEIKINAANAMGRIEVTVNDAGQPPIADATILAFLDGVHARSGLRVAYYKQRVDLHWVKQGERWLLADYTAYYNGQPIDAASSAAGNRAVPKR